MSAGMADIIAAHSPIGVDPESWDLGAQTRWRCFGCGAVEGAESAPNHDVTKSIWHGVHVAQELTKAGYGNVIHAQAVALRAAARDAYGRTDLGRGGPSGASVATFLKTRAHLLEATA